MNQSIEHIQIGKISGVFGLQGWVKIFSYTSPRLDIAEYKNWYLKNQGNWNKVRLLEGKEQGKNIVVKLQGVNDRNQAEALVGSEIAITSDQLKSLPQGEYYWKDLLGLTVETIKGEELGIIDWLFDTGSNDVIVINGEGINEPERMIPYIMNDVVVSVDLEKSRMIVDWDYDF